jgi:cell division protein FtsL
LRAVPRDRAAERARRRRARAFTIAAGAAVALLLFGVVAFNVMLTQGQLQLDRLQARQATEQARLSRLRLEVAQLEAPERVVAAAQQQLGMVPPPGVTYLSPSGAASTPPTGARR